MAVFNICLRLPFFTVTDEDRWESFSHCDAAFAQRKRAQLYLIWCLLSPHDRSRMAVGLIQPATWAICSLSGHFQSYIHLNPEFAYHTRHIGYRQFLKLSKRRPVKTLPYEQNTIFCKIKVWREDVNTMLSSCSYTQSWTWLFPTESGSL